MWSQIFLILKNYDQTLKNTTNQQSFQKMENIPFEERQIFLNFRNF